MRDLLEGYIDMHVHNGPSNVDRLFNTGEFAIEADQVGCRAFITKDHYFPSMMTALQANSLLEDKVQTRAYGSLILNNSVGGINLKAVDAACALGVKYISFPTISAANHIRYYEGRAFVGAKGLVLDEKPIAWLKEDGSLTDDAEDLLVFLSKLEKPPVLATGHGSREEQAATVKRAAELNVPILVNHPYYGFDVHVEDLIEWAKMGAYIELTAATFQPGKFPKIHDFVGTHEFLQTLFDNIPVKQFVVDSDMGQRIFPSPVIGMYNFAKSLIDDYGMKKSDVDIMLKETPAKLMHL